MYSKLKMMILGLRWAKNTRLAERHYYKHADHYNLMIFYQNTAADAWSRYKAEETCGSGFVSDVSSAFTRLLSWLREPAGK